MRMIFAGAVSLLLVACSAPAPSRTAAAEGCTRTSTHDVTWTNQTNPDVVTARADGPSCAQAVVTLVIRDSEGNPLWTYASTYYDMTIGGHSTAPEPVTAANVDRFLASWVDVTLNRSGELPEWREGSASLSAASNGLSYNTDLDREMYEALRARNLPQLCFAASVGASHCLVIDPMSQAPIVIVAYGS